MDSEEFRLAREYAAWILLAATAVHVFLGAWELLGLPGGPFSESALAGHVSASMFVLRAEAAIPDLIAVSVTALPVTAVLLVALAGRPPARALRVTVIAVTIQGIAMLLGLIAWLGVVGSSGRWFPISSAAEIAVAAAGLIITTAVLRSPALR
jgi:hypothetical protein